ncbi:protein kinase family protein [Nonomuraea sp. NPDC050786]|uniref:protein kinase family protein n=1 Tax=Nonomuraea sp. NPDC050786 TaxID=3154840 RepID=UPI003406CFB2
MDALSAGAPQRIGSYWLAGRLGSGGQGVVYDAYDADGNRVAVKVLHAAGDRALRDRFAKEATAARRVSSFCTARVLAADLDGHTPYRVSEYLWTARIGGQGGALTDVHFTQDGRRLAMNVVFEQKPMAKEVVLDAADGHVLSSAGTRYHGGPLLPGDKAYASLLGGRFVDLATGKAVGSGFGPTNAIAFSRNGLMAVKEDATGRVGLWSVDGPAQLRPAMPRAAADLLLLTFSPDGRTLATVTEQGVLQLWDVASRRRLGESYQLGEDGAASLQFSADGGTLYAGTDGAVHAIAVQDERVAREVCARAGRSLSPAEWERYLGGAPYQNVCP